MNQGHIGDELLVKYLLGEATTEEQALAAQWIEASDANKRYFENFKLIWEHSRKLAVTSTVNEEEAWLRFKQRIAEPAKPKTIELRPNFAWARAASILLVIAVGGLLTYFIANRGPEMIALNSGNNVLIDTLPDGSVVTLNKQSTLSYPEDFDGDTRALALTGEAFFNVTPDKNKPFIISVNEVTVKVVGTSFNVKSTNAKTEVIVETGIVSVKKKQNEVKLNPHEKATVLQSGDTIATEGTDDALYNYYRTKEFVCNSTPLWRLVDVLNDAYGVNIIIGNSRLKNLELTTTFRDEPIEKVLDIIKETLKPIPVEIEPRGTDIIIK